MASEEQLPELELSLGLSVGGSSRRPAAGTTVGLFSLNFPVEDGKAGRGDLQLPTEARIGATPETVCSEDERLVLEQQWRETRTRSLDSREKELLEDHRWRFGSKPGGIGSPPLVPVLYRPYPQEMYVPAVDGLGLPCMIPCWAPVVSPAGEGPNPPVGCRCSWTAEKDVAVMPVRTDSTGSNSSGISVRRSGSMQARSRSSSCSDTQGKSLHISEKAQHQKAASAQVQVTDEKLAWSIPASDITPAFLVPKLEGLKSVNKPFMVTKKPERPFLSPMPCVMTTGDGPNGKRITGVLYKYNQSEQVSILCVCHGMSFSPAEFVRHAGGTETAHPLRQIVVLPS